MGEGEPEAVRLQRHQGRHVRRRLRRRAGSMPTRGDADKLMKGPYDAATKATWDKALGELKEFNQNVVITPGNAGTLDMLNRGEIAMGPVWVDMFYTWMADGKLPPNMRCKLIAPGMPGQPMYYAIPAKAANAEARGGVRRAGDQPRGAGGRHRQALQLVSGHRRQERRRQARHRRPGTSCSPTSRRRTWRARASRSRSRPTSTTSSRAYERKVAN